MKILCIFIAFVYMDVLNGRWQSMGRKIFWILGCGFL